MPDLRAYGISIAFHMFFDTRFLIPDKVFKNLKNSTR